MEKKEADRVIAYLSNYGVDAVFDGRYVVANSESFTVIIKDPNPVMLDLAFIVGAAGKTMPPLVKQVANGARHGYPAPTL